MFAKFGN